MQTDWGGEYQKLNSFFQKIGIVHHVSCPHAHQQNGSAERKHRHIIEVGLSLLAQASMPLKFWDEAFLAATYLINRTPSRVIDFSTPLYRLFHDKPNYSFLRVFGCACWPNLRPYNKHKLQFRSKQCAFLGYSNLHKGYKCLDISTGRVYISRDVVFDESIFPFSNLHPNAGSRLKSEILLLPPSLLNSFGDMNNSIYPMANASLEPSLSCADHSPDASSECQQATASDSGTSSLHFHVFPNSNGGPVLFEQGDSNTDTRAALLPAGSDPSVDMLSTPAQHVAPADLLAHAAVPLSVSEPAVDPVNSPAATTTNLQESSIPHPASPGCSAPPGPTSTSGSSGRHIPPPPPGPPRPLHAPIRQRPRTRLQDNIRQPKQYTDGTIRYGLLSEVKEPRSLDEALVSPDWKAAMDTEFQALIKNQTWHLVSPTSDQNIIDCKWVYKVKRKADGSIDRYKTSLVAKGFKQ